MRPWIIAQRTETSNSSNNSNNNQVHAQEELRIQGGGDVNDPLSHFYYATTDGRTVAEQEEEEGNKIKDPSFLRAAVERIITTK